jgi:hypothetical protein
MTLSLKDRAEMMRPAADLHRDNAWPQFSRKFGHSLATHPSAHQDGSNVV